MLWALIIQRIFSIPTDILLLTFLNYSRELRDFCGFSKVPDPSKITRFKQDFKSDLEAMFEGLVDLTEPICRTIDPDKAAMTIFDSSGIEAYVTENNPKYANKIIKQLKFFAKAHGFSSSYDPYKAAYGSMPSHAAANDQVKQQYLDGHFCYAYKIGIVTNGLGIIRHLDFYDRDFLKKHPDIPLKKKTDSPDEDKSIHDSRLLIPTLKDMFLRHPDIIPHTFLGDAAFDSAHIYSELLSRDTFGSGKNFQKAYIPLNSRSLNRNPDCPVNENGIPCCPNNPDLPMKQEGKAYLINGTLRWKFVCPLMSWELGRNGKAHRVCHCNDPCTDSLCGRMVYIYPEKDLRTYPGVLRGTEEWENTYKVRTFVERAINHMKESFGLAGRKTQNAKTLHADLFLAGITQLITVLVADRIHRHEYLRSLKPLYI